VNLLCLLLRERFVAEKVQCVKRCEKYLHQDGLCVCGWWCVHPPARPGLVVAPLNAPPL
jgi:hypothetical protein